MMFKRMVVFLFVCFFLSFAEACEKWGSAEFSDMMLYLSKGKIDSAIAVWQIQHCEDSLAWTLANELVGKKINPDSLYQKLLFENCQQNWVYSSIPIYYICYFQKGIEAKQSIDHIASFLSDASSQINCDEETKNILYIDFDFLYNIRKQ